MELRDELEEEGLDEDAIDAKCDAFRAKLLEKAAADAAAACHATTAKMMIDGRFNPPPSWLLVAAIVLPRRPVDFVCWPRTRMHQ